MAGRGQAWFGEVRLGEVGQGWVGFVVAVQGKVM